MPTYEYECNDCKHRFEVFQSIKDNPIEQCEKCHGAVRKLFSSTGIIFKGSGFYVTDYKNKEQGRNKEKVTPKSSASAASDSSGSKGDSSN